MALQLGCGGQPFTIGRDVLNVGSRRKVTPMLENDDALQEHIPTLTFGRPGQFDVPNVPDVSLRNATLSIMHSYFA